MFSAEGGWGEAKGRPAPYLMNAPTRHQKIRLNSVNHRPKILTFFVPYVTVHITTPQEPTFMDNDFDAVFLEETFPDVELPSYRATCKAS